MFTLAGLGEKHGGQPGRIRCYSSDQNQKMQEFPVARSALFRRLNNLDRRIAHQDFDFVAGSPLYET
jgi:hypothetical protein